MQVLLAQIDGAGGIVQRCIAKALGVLDRCSCEINLHSLRVLLASTLHGSDFDRTFAWQISNNQRPLFRSFYLPPVGGSSIRKHFAPTCCVLRRAVELISSGTERNRQVNHLPISPRILAPVIWRARMTQ